MGRLRTKPIRAEEQFVVVDDLRLRLSLASLADRYSEAIREFVYRCYQDDELHSLYRAIRASGDFQHGGKSKIHRKVVEFPNGYVYDFVDTVLRQLYGKDWIKDPRALRHELVRPWHVVANL